MTALLKVQFRNDAAPGTSQFWNHTLPQPNTPPPDVDPVMSPMNAEVPEESMREEAVAAPLPWVVSVVYTVAALPFICIRMATRAEALLLRAVYPISTSINSIGIWKITLDCGELRICLSTKCRPIAMKPTMNNPAGGMSSTYTRCPVNTSPIIEVTLTDAVSPSTISWMVGETVVTVAGFRSHVQPRRSAFSTKACAVALAVTRASGLSGTFVSLT